ncbi:hypothetical protein VNO77_42659 [Canavalia gladiata]|uniref:Uncharacterized protein n=1 Tax=Canavalia gladiata TaxID=3824 RepID=A0AAN9PP88_CANGL
MANKIKSLEAKFAKLVLADNEVMTAEGEIITLELDKKKEAFNIECKVMELLEVTMTSHLHQNLGVEAALDGVPVIVLVESDASHNSVSSEVTCAFLGFSMNPTKGLSIRLHGVRRHDPFHSLLEDVAQEITVDDKSADVIASKEVTQFLNSNLEEKVVL